MQARPCERTTPAPGAGAHRRRMDLVPVGAHSVGEAPMPGRFALGTGLLRKGGWTWSPVGAHPVGEPEMPGWFALGTGLVCFISAGQKWLVGGWRDQSGFWLQGTDRRRYRPTPHLKRQSGILRPQTDHILQASARVTPDKHL
jgi:hypothetical protein